MQDALGSSPSTRSKQANNKKSEEEQRSAVRCTGERQQPFTLIWIASEVAAVHITWEI